MPTSFLSLILTGLFPIMVGGGDFWLNKQSKKKTLESNLAITQADTLIDVYDKLGIQQPEKNSKLTWEASWDANGALLLNHTRHPETLAQRNKNIRKS